LLPSLKCLGVVLLGSRNPQLCSSILLFLHDGLEILCIDFGNVGQPETTRYFLREIPLRAPAITSVAFTANPAGFYDEESWSIDSDFGEDTSKDTSMEEDLLAFVQGLKAVETISVNRYWITPKFLQALGQISTLKRVSVPKDHHYRIREVPRMDMVTYPFDSPTLTKLSLTVIDITDLSCLTNSDPLMLPRLEDFELYTNIGIDMEEDRVKQLLSAFAEVRPSMKSVSLFLHVGGSTSPMNLAFDTLSPLLALPNIKKFFVRYTSCLSINLQELEELLVRWPKLEELALCAVGRSPIHPEAEFSHTYHVIHIAQASTTTIITSIYSFLSESPQAVPADPWIDVTPNSGEGMILEALRVVARLNPNIRQLGLYLDWSPQELSNEPLQLPNLTDLHVGTARVQDSRATAAFLVDLCNANVNIIPGSCNGTYRV